MSNVLVTSLISDAGKHKLFTDSGTEELGMSYQRFHHAAVAALQAKGHVRDRDLLAGTFPGTGHNEPAWAARLHVPNNWWLKG
jgi:hypothetical protein